MSQEAELARFADEVRPFIRSHRAATERERRIAGPIVDRLIQSGVCRMALLRDAGGLETDPVVACRVYEQLAWAEPSVAWIVQDVFVAEPHCFSWLAGSKVDTPFARLPIFALMGAGCASICLARRRRRSMACAT